MRLSLLLPDSQVAHEPLAAWAERLCATLANLSQVNDALARARLIDGVANSAALVAAHEGRFDIAKVICEENISWLQREGIGTGNLTIAGLAVRSWINECRLIAADGHWQIALERLDGMRRFSSTGILSVRPPVALERSAFTVLCPPNTTIDEFFWALYVLQSARTLISSRQFLQAIDFASMVGSRCSRDLEPFVTECVIVAKCALGDYAVAREMTEAASCGPRGWHFVFKVRLLEIAVQSGQTATETRGLAAELLDRAVATIDRSRSREPTTLRVLVHLAKLCQGIGELERAEYLAKWTCAGAVEANDDVMRIESLRVLETCAPEAERTEWQLQCREALRRTLYHRYRKVPGTRDVVRPSETLVATLRNAWDGRSSE